jgi:hypothetical protein
LPLLSPTLAPGREKPVSEHPATVSRRTCFREPVPFTSQDLLDRVGMADQQAAAVRKTERHDVAKPARGAFEKPERVAQEGTKMTR